jgi:hypothetical protein
LFDRIAAQFRHDVPERIALANSFLPELRGM